MKRADLNMTAALVGSLLFSAAAVLTTHHEARSELRTEQRSADSNDSIVDSTGQPAPRKPYLRIASGSILADRLLLELSEPERIVGLSRHGLDGSAVAFRYGARASIEIGGDLEAIVALRPDLLLVNDLTDQRRIARLREAGIVVFDLGPMLGLGSLLSNITTVAALLGVEDRGLALAQSTKSRMNAIAADIAPTQRRSAVYVGVHGMKFYGGTRNTSYHDVLVYAGLIDRAAADYEGWPAYSPEALLALNPDVIVTTTGNRAVLCSNSALEAMTACGPQGKVVELDSRLVMDPSLSMVDASLALRDAVYGPAKGPTP